jgi:hypothetical protein
MPYGNLLADVVQGSTANTPPVFKDGNGTAIGTLCRAWVNFNGTGTVAIRASFNVSSITDNGTGLYTVNFTTAMSDANYATLSTGTPPTENIGIVCLKNGGTYSTSAVQIRCGTPGVGFEDFSIINVSILR